MSESPKENPPDHPSEVAPDVRGRFQFSIRSLLLFTLIVALALTSLLMYRRMAKAEKELLKLRNEAGYLAITDETVFQGIAIPCEEPLTWKWRCYLPKGSKYSWHLDSGMVPAAGVSGGGANFLEVSPRSQGAEVLVTVSLRKDPDPKYERWIFNLKSRSEEGSENQWVSTSIPDPIMNQILQANMTEGCCFGEHKAETRKRGETIILLKRRIGEEITPTSWEISSKPQPGLAVWLREVK